MIEAVLFDIDGVLLNSFEANLIFFQDLMKFFDYPVPTREIYAKCFHMPMWDTIKKITGLSEKTDIDKIWQVAKGREVPYPVDLLEVPKDAEAVITSLKKNYRLGIVTSRTKTGVFEAPELMKMKNMFEVVITYEDTEHHKPHPAPLLLAAKEFAIASESIVYIGDTATDMKAARAAGMKIIIYSKEQISEADAHTSSLIHLPQLIADL